jgi:tyrosyl-tRNA synthetase
MPLLVGLDGVEKMSKSKGNTVGISEKPFEIFGKLMSISDDLMWQYLELLSCRPMSHIQALRAEVQAGRNPRDVKVDFAMEMVERFHSAEAARDALAEFEARFKQGAIPDDIAEVSLPGAPMGIVTVLKQSGLAPSSAEAIRNIEQGGVRVDGGKISDRSLQLEAGTYVIQIGKRKFARVSIA